MSTWIVLGVIGAAILYIVMVYNGLVALRQRVSQAFADIDVQLKQRHDLIPNLIETVKGYASHEKRHARCGDQGAQRRDRGARAGGAGQCRKRADRRACAALIALSEAYPDLKANTNFQQLQTEIGRHRKQDRRRAPFLQQRRAGIQYRHRAVSRPRCVAGLARASRSANSSISAKRAASSNRHRRSSSKICLDRSGESRIMAAYGLYTSYPSNKRRSVVLLVGLFFLIYLLVFAGALLAEGFIREHLPFDAIVARGLARSDRGRCHSPRSAPRYGCDRLSIPPGADRRHHRRARGDARGGAAALQSSRKSLHLARHPDAEAQGDGQRRAQRLRDRPQRRSNIRSR